MPKYTPIETVPKMQSSLSDLVDLRWRDRGLTADFLIPEDKTHVLRVRFEKLEIVRILDEMPLSTESEITANEGLIPEHFAYSVEGALFWESQSEALKIVYPSLRHYRFITGWTCLDVLSDREPSFLVVPVSRPRSQRSPLSAPAIPPPSSRAKRGDPSNVRAAILHISAQLAMRRKNAAFAPEVTRRQQEGGHADEAGGRVRCVVGRSIVWLLTRQGSSIYLRSEPW